MKPIFKILIGVALLGGAIWGGSILYKKMKNKPEGLSQADADAMAAKIEASKGQRLLPEAMKQIAELVEKLKTAGYENKDGKAIKIENQGSNNSGEGSTDLYKSYLHFVDVGNKYTGSKAIPNSQKEFNEKIKKLTSTEVGKLTVFFQKYKMNGDSSYSTQLMRMQQFGKSPDEIGMFFLGTIENGLQQVGFTLSDKEKLATFFS